MTMSGTTPLTALPPIKSAIPNCMLAEYLNRKILRMEQKFKGLEPQTAKIICQNSGTIQDYAVSAPS